MEPSYYKRAACAAPEIDNSLFFPDIPKGAGRDIRATYEEPGKKVCRRCVVRDECLMFAIRMRIEEGVWGGMNGRERAEEARRLRTAARKGRVG